MQDCVDGQAIYADILASTADQFAVTLDDDRVLYSEIKSNTDCSQGI